MMGLFSTAKRVQPLPGQPALDWFLVSLWLALLSIGFIMVASASISFADTSYGDGWYFVKRHAVYLLLAIAAAMIVVLVPLSLWQRYSGWLLLAVLILLVVVLIPGIGRRVNGSQRWLALGPITIQVSELVKFAAIIFFASFFARRQAELQQNWRGFIKPMAVMALLALLLLLEPDFGSTVVICGTVVAMLFLAGVKLSHFSLLVVTALSSFILLAVLSPYRLLRLKSFMDPWADQFSGGYQLTQSLIAFGRGEWFGVGLGNSMQKLFFLPEAHTDFIFAIIAEEFGLLGACLLIGLFGCLIYSVLGLVKRGIVSGDRFASFVGFGIAILFAMQIFINIGVASGLLPTKGLTLPFISYGGSSLIVSCALMALLLRIDWEQRHPLLAPLTKSVSSKVAVARGDAPVAIAGGAS